MSKITWIKNVLVVAVLVITGFASNGVAKDKPLKIAEDFYPVGSVEYGGACSRAYYGYLVQ